MILAGIFNNIIYLQRVMKSNPNKGVANTKTLQRRKSHGGETIVVVVVIAKDMKQALHGEASKNRWTATVYS